jgi:hypothetical protein
MNIRVNRAFIHDVHAGKGASYVSAVEEFYVTEEVAEVAHVRVVTFHVVPPVVDAEERGIFKFQGFAPERFVSVKLLLDLAYFFGAFYLKRNCGYVAEAVCTRKTREPLAQTVFGNLIENVLLLQLSFNSK